MDGHAAFNITKSQLVTGGYKAAKDLTAAERKLIGAKAAGKTIRLKTRSGVLKEVKSKPNRMKTAPSAKGRQIYPGIKTERGKLTRVVASRSQTGAATRVQGFSRPDGRGGGHVVIHDDADFKTTAMHEMAHITPKRNPVHYFERTKNPTRLGREEGRADFVAHGRQTAGQYPGSEDFQRGYNEVQGKMASAKGRKEKFGR